MAATLHRDGSRAVLDPIDPVGGRPEKSSTHNALAAALRAAGEDLTYEWLMGASGHAFRTQFMNCPSSPHAMCGFSTWPAALDVIAFDVVEVLSPQDARTDDAIAAMRRRIVASIDAGTPVLWGSEEFGVVVGYENDGATFLAKGYFDNSADAPPAPLKEWPWAIIIPNRKPAAAIPDKREQAKRALRIAIQLEGMKTVGPYHLGAAAWDAWITELSGESITAMDEKQRRGAMLWNAWIYGGLIDARRCAAEFLRTAAREFVGEAGARLTRAAKLYDDARSTLERDRWDLVKYAFQLGEGQTWTTEQRREQVARLRAAREHEVVALAEMRAVLNA